jgi:hypothetical protein
MLEAEATGEAVEARSCRCRTGQFPASLSYARLLMYKANVASRIIFQKTTNHSCFYHMTWMEAEEFNFTITGGTMDTASSLLDIGKALSEWTIKQSGHAVEFATHGGTLYTTPFLAQLRPEFRKYPMAPTLRNCLWFGIWSAMVYFTMYFIYIRAL